MPLREYWVLQEQIKKLDYITAAGDDQILIGEQWQKILRKASTYLVHEEDHNLINERLKGQNSSNKP